MTINESETYRHWNYGNNTIQDRNDSTALDCFFARRLFWLDLAAGSLVSDFENTLLLSEHQLVGKCECPVTCPELYAPVLVLSFSCFWSGLHGPTVCEDLLYVFLTYPVQSAEYWPPLGGCILLGSFLIDWHWMSSSSLPGMPSFIKSPDDQTGISGGVASFVCQAVGDPKPRITWMKKGKKVSSQRFEVHGLLMYFIYLIWQKLCTPDFSYIANPHP